MVSKRQKPHGLQVPVPTFPLSSPISEEIASPSCSSAEDKELEKTRPFDFLVKSTREKIESRSEKEGNRSPNLYLREKQGEGSKLSIRGITKKRKNERKPLGLNLVTDFSLSAPPKKQREEANTAPFVDLNDLKLLSKAREKERTAQKTKTASKKRTLRGFQQLADERAESHNTALLEPKPENPFDDRHDHGLSPSDRHVMIGLTVPTHESSARSKELDSSGDLHTPLTPSIIVTPAREDALWPVDSPPRGLNPRTTSSVYSQPTPRIWQNETDIPPVPAIPQQHTGAKNLEGDSEILSAHLRAMTRKRRSMSAGTIIEDESPKTHRSSSQTALDDNDQAPLNQLSVNTEIERPQSQGWWTYLLSPLLGKKSPMSPSFPRASTAAAPSSQGATREWWEKETSCFSPESPETAVTNQWHDENKGFEQSRSLGVNDDFAHISKRQTTNSFMFPGRPLQGEAAEYYQACAHELFSKTPFFECHNHVCSITPASLIAAQTETGAVASENRGLAVAGVGIQESSVQAGSDAAAPASSAGDRGLLIDIDSPTEKPKSIEQAKTILSPASARSIDSWPSTAVSENEKSFPEPPRTTSKSISHEAPTQETAPVQAPAAVHEPAPAQPPVPIPMPIPDHEAAPVQPAPPMPAPAYEPAPVQPPVSMPEPASAPVSAPMAAPAPSPAPAPQIINNVHYTPPSVSNPPQPAVTERAVPQYVPVFPPTNPFATAIQAQPPPVDNSRSIPAPQEPPQEPEWPMGPLPVPSPDNNTQGQHAPADDSTPISPGFQRAAGGPGAIPLSEVNAPAPAYSQYPREAALPPRYDLHPAPGAAIMNPTGDRGPMESRRRRLEREDATGRKIGGLWRGRGCFSNKGCFGRPGREGRVRRRWYFAICTFFLIIVIVAIVLATTLTKKGDATLVQSQWLNLTGYPPMPTGISTIAGSETKVDKSTCVQPSSLWSCALPPDQQTDNKPYTAEQPNFRVEIRFRNGTYSHGTDTVGKPKRDDNSLFTPKPATPSAADQTFLGNTTDGNVQPYAGEETPFYMSILSPVRLSSTNLYRRSGDSGFPNLTSIVPPPETNADQTAAAAVLHPLPEAQPVRLYNRGESDEHYGFYTYFDKSIFLESMGAMNGTDQVDPNDTNGGARKSDAKIRCTWSQTRFLVQIWTQPTKLERTLLSAGGGNGTGSATASASTPTSTSSKSSSSATDYTHPGSFPYPITISIDRHGGNAKEKLVYCYALKEDGRYNITYKKLELEDRGAGGKLVNPSTGVFKDGDKTKVKWGGTDGGTGGCQCQWTNWISTS